MANKSLEEKAEEVKEKEITPKRICGQCGAVIETDEFGGQECSYECYERAMRISYR
jgi:predicted nucleic acid-binding Zn ribbon protein